ncbi:MAG TPA: hypothetical protein ENN14_00020 [Chloroflexi bacterium]|nr:hypothetical protein [Chloroflexota bacterium]
MNEASQHEQKEITISVEMSDGMIQLGGRQIDARVFGVVIGSSLIGLGCVLLFGALLGIRIGQFIWPWFIIAPGVLGATVALSIGSPADEIVMVPASIVTMVGVLLFYQSITGHWESWAYAWALVAPTSIGLGKILFGMLKGREEMIHIGNGLATSGLFVFAIGFIFFELLLNISGFGLGFLGWAIVLIGLGTLMILKSFLKQLL